MRILLLKPEIRTRGLGHVSRLLPSMLLLAMATDRALFWDLEYAIDHTRFMVGYGGFDAHFGGRAVRTAWRACGLREHTIQVENDAEKLLRRLDQAGPAPWITLSGLLMDVPGGPGLSPAKAPPLWPSSALAAQNMTRTSWARYWKRLGQGVCRNCALFASLRPKPEHPLWHWLAQPEQLGQRRALICFKFRTQYVDDPTCFPQDTAQTWEAMDALYKHQPCTHIAQRQSLKLPGQHHATSREEVPLSAHFAHLRELVERARAAAQVASRASQRSPPPEPKALILTDSPALHTFLSAELARAGVSQLDMPGKAVHPTSPKKLGGVKLLGKGTDVDHARVFADFYVQPLCNASVVLTASAFYRASEDRLSLCHGPARALCSVPATG